MGGMGVEFDGFASDHGHREKCQKHGVSLGEIEDLFLDSDPSFFRIIGIPGRKAAAGDRPYGRRAFAAPAHQRPLQAWKGD
jgi:uncharacterized DUF497 family protein